MASPCACWQDTHTVCIRLHCICRSNITDDHVFQSNKEEGRGSLCQDRRAVCECRPDRQTVCIRASHRRVATSLLNWLVVADGSSAKQRGRWRQPLLASSPWECLPRHAHTLHPPRTEEQPQACSIGRWSLTAPVQSKEDCGDSLCWRAARLFGSTTNTLHSPHTEEARSACSILLVGGRCQLRSKANRKAAAACVGEQPLRVPARQTNTLVGDPWWLRCEAKRKAAAASVGGEQPL